MSEANSEGAANGVLSIAAPSVTAFGGDSSPLGGAKIYSLLPLTLKHGGVPVSTGVWRQDKRAVAPDHHKTGTLKLTDNTKTVAVAA